MQQTSSQWIEEPICTVNGERVVKKYSKIKVVGEGSYSKCWLVKTTNSDSTYVAKIIPKKKLQLLVKQKLVYEIRIHQQLSHPNVVHLDHWFEDENYQYIFMEYCSEGNLQKKLQAKSKMAEKQIRYYARQVVQAIMYIHSKNILHRDLKLCNFYIDSSDTLKLGDFGFACQLSHSNQLKRQTCGTPNYIAPEAVSGFGYSFSSDVWAVGVVLYRLKYKMCPFQGRSVRETLQKVKTCQYNFPKGDKISAELKNLIQNILVINYDERLTLQQILAHPFFEGSSPRPASVMQSRNEAPRAFSLFKGLFSKEKDSGKQRDDRKEGKKGGSKETKKGKQKQKEEVAKRSNSCQTFKQIKQIFKNKSKGTLATNMGTQMKTEESIGSSYMTHNVNSNRQKTLLGNSTIRSIAQNTMSMNIISKRLQQSSRVNNFIGNVKQQLKVQSKHTNVPQTKSISTGSQQLSAIMKKYYLPYDIQFQKDVVIVHYKQSIKQLIYHNTSYILHRNKQSLYEMNGQLPTGSLPKVVKYIIDNKIQIAEAEQEQEEYGQNTIQKILLFVSHKWILMKDGIILRFGSSGLFVTKMITQQLFYIGSATKDGQKTKQDGKISLMYVREHKAYKCAQGVVLSRIYQGWISNALKNGIAKE